MKSWSRLVTSLSLSVHTSRNVKKTRTIVNFDPVSGRHGGNILLKTTHASSEVVGRHLDVAVGALMLLSSTLSILGLRETCHKCQSRLKGKGVCRFGQNYVQESCWKTPQKPNSWLKELYKTGWPTQLSWKKKMEAVNREHTNCSRKHSSLRTIFYIRYPTNIE